MKHAQRAFIVVESFCAASVAAAWWGWWGIVVGSCVAISVRAMVGVFLWLGNDAA